MRRGCPIPVVLATGGQPFLCMANTMCRRAGCERNICEKPVTMCRQRGTWTKCNRKTDKNPAFAVNNTGNPNFKDAYTVHFEGAKHLSLTDLPLFSPILANMLQRGKADIDKYYCIETMNRLILKFYDYTLKGTGQFAPQAVY